MMIFVVQKKVIALHSNVPSIMFTKPIGSMGTPVDAQALLAQTQTLENAAMLLQDATTMSLLQAIPSKIHQLTFIAQIRRVDQMIGIHALSEMGIATCLNAPSVCCTGMMPKTFCATMPIAHRRMSTNAAEMPDIVLRGLAHPSSCTNGMLNGSIAKSTFAQT
jgi:hypothetical protein